jgi:PAS domain S-box-containing protein
MEAIRVAGGRECWRYGVSEISARLPTERVTEGERAALLLAAIIDSSDDAIISKDLNGIVTSWNKSAERLFGYTAAEMVGQSITILIPPDRQDEEPKILSRLRRGERVDHFQTIRRRKDGELLDISLTISPVRDVGNIVGASKIARDITQQKRAEEALFASEARFRQLANAMPQMVWTATPAGDLDYVSVQVTRYFDAPPESLLGAGWLQWVHPDDQELAVKRWKRSLDTGEPYEIEFRLLRGSDRSWRWHLVRAEVSEAGQIIKWFGTCTDIEEQKRVQGTLSEQARISALGADIGTALTQVSSLKESLHRCTQAIVTHLDAAFSRIWTLSPKQDVLELQASAGLYTHLDGAHARVPVGSFKIGRIALHRRAHLTNNVLSDPEVSDREWAKREGMVAFAGYPLIVEDRLIGVLGLFARHSLGQDTVNALASVAATIAIAIERKRSEEALVSQAEELRRSNEDLEQFAHVASHDLRSPLNTILQFTDMMVRKQGGSLDAEMGQLLQIIRNSAGRMGDLISALLSYSRLNDENSREVRPISSLTAYENAVANLSAAISEAQARIDRADLPDVLSNPAQLLQVFQNLISNALHYRGAATPHIRVSAERQNSFWLFSVSDNGPGIAPQYHSVIFEPFKRLHGADRPGSGIGLAFCRKFIEREGGKIWVESEEAKGATFRFTLPAVENKSSAFST